MFLDTIKFSEISLLLDMINEAANIKKRQNLFKQFFNQIKSMQIDYIRKHPDHISTLYPLIRLLFASEEVERIYRIQEFRLRKIIIKVMQLQSVDVKTIETCSEDHLPDILFEIVNSRKSTNKNNGTLSVAEVDHALDRLKDDAEAEFSIIYQKCCARDLKWIVRIILKNMKLKISDKMILENYHQLAYPLFERYNHLSKVCEFIESGQAERALMEIRPFLPCRSMLAQKLTNKDFLSNVADLYSEIKMDGERFQLHMEEGNFKYYSRNSHDYSEGFNKLISPRIKFKSVVHSLLLDGEMLIYSKQKSRFITKGEISDIDVKRMQYESDTMRPCYCPFDVLYFNGVSYLDSPYSERVKILENLIIDEEGVIMRVKSQKILSSESFTDLMNTAINNQEEGLILKKGSSTYKPGERNAGWFKVKPDYLDHSVVKDFDTVIIGASFHNSHLRDYIAKYTLGAIKRNDDGSFDAFSIGEAVHGVSVSKRMELSQTLIAIGSEYFGQDVIPYEKGKIILGKCRPHLIIPPHKSRILEIRASELSTSFDFYTMYTFRFPRIQCIRTDKIWDEAISLDEFEELYKNANGQVVKITIRDVHQNDIASPPKKKTKSKGTFKDALQKYCVKNDNETINPIDKILSGVEFCVLSSTKDLPSVEELKTLLKLHNASITAFPRVNKTFAIVAADITSRNIKNYIRRPNLHENHNVIKIDWLINNLHPSLPLGKLPTLHPRDFLFINDKLMKHFERNFDKYGDSYKEPLENIEKLMEIINDMTGNLTTINENMNMKTFDDELYNDVFPNPNIFRGISGVFLCPEAQISFILIAEECFKFRGGKVIEKVEADNETINFVDHINFKATNFNQKIIKYQWIFDSIEAEQKLNFKSYRV